MIIQCKLCEKQSNCKLTEKYKQKKLELQSMTRDLLELFTARLLCLEYIPILKTNEEE